MDFFTGLIYFILGRITKSCPYEEDEDEEGISTSSSSFGLSTTSESVVSESKSNGEQKCLGHLDG